MLLEWWYLDSKNENRRRDSNPEEKANRTQVTYETKALFQQFGSSFGYGKWCSKVEYW